MSITLAWQQNLEPVWQAARGHDFLQQLVDGRLAHETFLYYLHQDAWFLGEDAKVMAIAASRAPTLALAARLGELISAVNAAERDRHRVFAEILGRPLDTPNLRPAPTAYAYVSHLKAVALDGSLLAILAALLPCPWLYSDFGRHFADRNPPDAVYRDWLAPYKDAGLAERVRFHRDLVDDFHAQASTAERARAERAFETSIRYEVRFWDMAMNRESW